MISVTVLFVLPFVQMLNLWWTRQAPQQIHFFSSTSNVGLPLTIAGRIAATGQLATGKELESGLSVLAGRHFLKRLDCRLLNFMFLTGKARVTS
jgi:hypothetical protein